MGDIPDGLGVSVRNILRRAKQGYFNDDTQIDELVDMWERYVNSDLRTELKELHNKNKTCEHEYNSHWFTVQKRIFGFVTVYERQCKHCRYVDTHSPYNEKPEWHEKAKERYYNNNI